MLDHIPEGDNIEPPGWELGIFYFASHHIQAQDLLGVRGGIRGDINTVDLPSPLPGYGEEDPQRTPDIEEPSPAPILLDKGEPSAEILDVRILFGNMAINDRILKVVILTLLEVV